MDMVNRILNCVLVILLMLSFAILAWWVNAYREASAIADASHAKYVACFGEE